MTEVCPRSRVRVRREFMEEFAAWIHVHRNRWLGVKRSAEVRTIPVTDMWRSATIRRCDAMIECCDVLLLALPDTIPTGEWWGAMGGVSDMLDAPVTLPAEHGGEGG